MGSWFRGPSNLAGANAETISGAARSLAVNLIQFAGQFVEISTPAGFDRTVDFQVTFDDPLVVASSANWIDAAYVDLSAPATGAQVGAFSPGATVRKVYKILTQGCRLSVNVAGGTTGNLTWRVVATDDGGALSQGFAGAPGTGGTASLSAATTGTGTVVAFGGARQTIAMQCVGAVGTTAGTILLEGSIDGTNYVTLATYAVGADGLDAIKVSSGVPVLYARARFTVNASGGAGPAVTATICAI